SVEAHGTAENRFGRLADMGGLEDNLRGQAVARMERSLLAPRPPATERWLTHLIDLLRGKQIAFAIVELPMREGYRRAVRDTRIAQAYRERLERRLTEWGGTLLDLGEPDWIDDSYFADALHLGENGARLFSSDLGAQLGGVLK